VKDQREGNDPADGVLDSGRIRVLGGGPLGWTN